MRKEPFDLINDIDSLEKLGESLKNKKMLNKYGEKMSLICSQKTQKIKA